MGYNTHTHIYTLPGPNELLVNRSEVEVCRTSSGATAGHNFIAMSNRLLTLEALLSSHVEGESRVGKGPLKIILASFHLKQTSGLPVYRDPYNRPLT